MNCEILRELIPGRNRMLKILSTAAVFILCCICLVFLYGQYLAYSSELSALRAKKRALNEEFNALQNEAGRLAEDSVILEKLREAKLPETEMLLIIEDLTARLPEHMWITSLVQNGELFDLVIYSSKDDLGLYKKMNDSGLFQVVNLKKMRSASDTGVLYQANLRQRQRRVK